MTSSSSGQDTASTTTAQAGFDASTQFQTLIDGIEQSVFAANEMRAKAQIAQTSGSAALQTAPGEQLTALSPTSGLGQQLSLNASNFAVAPEFNAQPIVGYAQTLSLIPSNDLVVGFLGANETAPAGSYAGIAGWQAPAQVSAVGGFEPVQAGLQNLIQAMASFTAANSAFAGTPVSPTPGAGSLVSVAASGAWMGAGH